jgi:peptide/nickel transport system substrate-binding protein
MIKRTTKLRWRRSFRSRRKQVGEFSQQAEDQLDRHIFRRLGKLFNIRRFVIGWTTLLILLILITVFQTIGLSVYYQTLQPEPGGTYSEGMVGNYTTSNPIFASGVVDSTVSSLIFAGLLKYNQSNQLVGDLAQSWKSDPRGIVWTVTLKNNLKWQDGKPLTAADVVFTFQTIQNPDTQSPLFSSWQGVSIKALDARTIQFTLPDPLSSFPESLTTGIIPQHILGSIAPSQLRSIEFNTIDPVGAGPFKWAGLNVYTISASQANPLYNGGQPKLSGFNVYAYSAQSYMLNSFYNRTINAMVGLNSLPKTLNNNSNIYSYNVPLTAEVMVFFRNSQAILSDIKVRQALVQAINQDSAINSLGYSVIPAKSPLLPFQIGYQSSILQLPTNITAANQELTQDGWIMGSNGIRSKDGKTLSFQLFTQDDSEYNNLAANLISQWKKVGVDVTLISEQPTALQTTVAQHSYDALLYGIAIGVDPDVFVYWDSSQAAPNAIPRLNLSEYESSTADTALEAGRITTDPAERAIKYSSFLQAWEVDAPALALYQPRFLYVTRGKVFNLNPAMFNTGTDRFSNVQNWEIREVKKTNI